MLEGRFVLFLHHTPQLALFIKIKLVILETMVPILKHEIVWLRNPGYFEKVSIAG